MGINIVKNYELLSHHFLWILSLFINNIKTFAFQIFNRTESLRIEQSLRITRWFWKR